MKKRSAPAIVLVLVLLLGGLAYFGAGPLKNALDLLAYEYFKPDCEQQPNQPPCLVEEATASAQQDKPSERAVTLSRAGQVLSLAPGGYARVRSRILFDEALALANDLEPEKVRSSTLAVVGIHLLQADDPRGRDIIDKVPDWFLMPGGAQTGGGKLQTNIRASGLSLHARKLAWAGEADAARRTALRQLAPDWRVNSLFDVAMALIRNNDRATAEKFVDEALAMMGDLPPPKPAEDHPRSRAARALARIGRTDDAMAMAASMEDPRLRAVTYKDVAIILAGLGQIAEAQKTYDVIAIPPSGKDWIPRGRRMAFRMILEARARAGELEWAEAQLAQVADPTDRMIIALDLVGIRAANGDLAGALEKLEEVAKTYSLDMQLDIILRESIEQQRFEQVEQVLAKADEPGYSLHLRRTHALAEALALDGRFEKALTYARSGEPRVRASALLLIAELKLKGP